MGHLCLRVGRLGGNEQQLVGDTCGSDKAKGDPFLPGAFFMKQTQKLDCACGIIACIHAVLNNQESIALDPDTILGRFSA
jgi:ubiquitin carboxyl-terminal hydrolase L3